MKSLNILYRPLKTSDDVHLSTALDLLNQTQGMGLFSSDYITTQVNSEQALVVSAFFENKLVGVGVANIITDFSYYIPFSKDIDSQLRGRKVGSFSTLSVAQDFQGKGIGQKISQLRLAWLKENLCTTIIGVSWVSGLSHTSNRVFERLGFSAIAKVADFYQKSSLEKPFFCPGCKNIPCICAAILYRLDFS